MKKLLYLFGLTLVLVSCKEEQLTPEDFREGEFFIEANDNFGRTDLVRIDSLQIETYKNVKENGITEYLIDTLIIHWNDNFNYTLEMKTPETDLDREIIYVQINKFEGKQYEFTATIGYSNYQQQGVLRKK